MNKKNKRTWAEINLSALEHNYKEIRRHFPEDCKFLGVVKADAYGHGAVKIAKKLVELGAEYLAVACIDEAIELREGGIHAAILILGVTPNEYASDIVKYKLTQTVSSLEMARELAQELGEASVCVHYKIDSGMGRLGFSTDRAVPEISEALKLKNLVPEGIYTHFATADEENDDFTEQQFSKFMDCIDGIESRNEHHFAIKHCANSGAVINYPNMALDMTRAGIALYGQYDSYANETFDLVPVMQFKTRISAIEEHKKGDTISYGRTYTASKDKKIAVISVGYADGLHRCLSNKMKFAVNGKLVPQVGRICMDMCMIDVSEVDCKNSDVVTIFGSELTALTPMAQAADTISYELLTSISPRVPRVYIL